MHHQLPRQIGEPELFSLVAREIKKQKLRPFVLRTHQVKELAKMVRIVAEEGSPWYLVRKKLPGTLGYGVFLHLEAKPLLKGQMVGPYSGEMFLTPQNAPNDSSYAFESLSRILLSREEQSYWDKQSRYHPRRFYALYVDALKKGNFTRFINHSETPNVVARLCRVPSNTYGVAYAPIEVIYFVKKTIQPGEQLLICYEGEDKSYWNALKIKPFLMTPRTFLL